MVEIVKLFLICAVILAVTTFEAAGWDWIEQKLDHFNKSDTRTWKMRYRADDAYYYPGGPVFIYIKGQDTGGPFTLTDYLLDDVAKSYFAYIYQPDHRYYGEFRPIKNLTVEGLKYLNAQQTLADLAHLIRTIKSSSPDLNNSKIILHGKSYGGSLAVWFKKLYPDLADGVWASGAPLLAKLDAKEYTEAIGNKIRVFGGDSCYNRLANVISKMEQMLAENRTAEIKSDLDLCDTFNATNELDVSLLFYYIIREVDIKTYSNHSTKLFCEQLKHDDFKAFYFYYSYPFNRCCVDMSYQQEICRAKTMIYESIFADPSLYQSCNELGWFPTTNSTQQPFGTKLPVSFFSKYCKDVFGDKFTLEYMENQINKTNQLFGGLNPQVENVYLTYNAFDSRLPLGIQDVKKATIIPLDSVDSDIKSMNYGDSDELKAAKNKFSDLVEKWNRHWE